MQRRAAAGYTGLFVLLTVAASYGILTGAPPYPGEEFETYKTHFWAIAAMSTVTAVVLLATAYMPVRSD